MTTQMASNQLGDERGGGATARLLPGQSELSSAQLAPEKLQRLVDEVAAFNLYIDPGTQGADTISSSGKMIGIKATEMMYRFDIDLKLSSSGSGVQAVNAVGEPMGRLDLRWMIIPHGYMARSDQEPPPTPLDSSRSQRFVMQEMAFAFGGQDGFLGFGTGRTFPTFAGRRSKLIVAAIGNITEGLGKFRGHEGNFTLCGELTAKGGFLGDILVRVVDQTGNLRTPTPLIIERRADVHPEATYLLWTGQKGKGPEQENRFSLGPDGLPRGMNIPTELRRLRLQASVQNPTGFLSNDLSTEEAIGLEIGFGRGSQPGAPPTGTPISPFQFEGVAKYSFEDETGRTIGAVTTNVLEGRRFDMSLLGIQETAWRFGFFGPIILGHGCFRDAQGMFYGASGSFFQPPPGIHVIRHLYMARLEDPDGRFRASGNGALG
jgi:hypothetical protein